MSAQPPPGGTTDRSSSTIPIGLVLAAGLSRRMGSAKLTLPWRKGLTVVGAVVAALRGGGVAQVLVVVGGDRQAVEAALSGSGVAFVQNPDFAQGDMLQSIQAGLQAMGGEAQAALVTPGDLPSIRPATVRAVIEAWSPARNVPCVPVYGGRRGHPVLLPRRSWAEVMALPPGESLRTFLRRHSDAIHHVTVNDPGIHADLDTPEDYETRR